MIFNWLKHISMEKKMIKHNKLISIIICISLTICLFSCSKSNPTSSYEKEDAAGTKYGAAIKSALYIEDFYFLTVGTKKSTVEILNGYAHYHIKNDELLPVYTLQNGDSISITYDENKKTVVSAEYTYSEDMEKENFFDILVELEILKYAGQETNEHNTTDIQDTQNQDSVTPPSNQETTNSQDQINQQTTQGEVFASGAYNLTLIEPFIKIGMARNEIVSLVGKPSFFSSHSFKANSYIIDCYNLDDGSKLYLDYGYERTNLRCAAIVKNGTVNNLLSTPWSEQSMPTGFSRAVSDINRVNRLTKNMTPAKVYSYLGEPSWYEGTRANYTDIFVLPNGSYAQLNFGSAHNRLTSLTIKGADGTITVII